VAAEALPISSGDAGAADRHVGRGQVRARAGAAPARLRGLRRRRRRLQRAARGRALGLAAERVGALLAQHADGLLFFAGCSEEQIALPFDYRVLLTVPRPVLVERLRTRTTNTHGRAAHELAQVLADVDEIEPLLRRSADLVLTTTVPVSEVADRLVEALRQ
jgi:hypothetical protein